jgi:hypothetical protein
MWFHENFSPHHMLIGKVTPSCPNTPFSNSILNTIALARFPIPAWFRVSEVLHIQMGHQRFLLGGSVTMAKRKKETNDQNSSLIFSVCVSTDLSVSHKNMRGTNYGLIVNILINKGG